MVQAEVVEIAPLKRKRVEHPEKEQAWDKKETSHRNRRKQKKHLARFALFVGFLLSALIAAGIYLKFNHEEKTSAYKSSRGISVKSEPILKVTQDELDEARIVAAQFLRLESIEDFPALIREPQRVMPLIRDYYRDTPYSPPGISTLNRENIAKVSSRFCILPVILQDQTTSPIALEFTNEGPRIDWESWIGYCEKPWNNFIEEKTTEATTVRIFLSRDTYYNFDFRDEKEWACFQLYRSPDEEVLYGYIPRQSSFLSTLPKIGKRKEAYLIRIKFPEQSNSSNQVIITDILQDGWVLGL